MTAYDKIDNDYRFPGRLCGLVPPAGAEQYSAFRKHYVCSINEVEHAGS